MYMKVLQTLLLLSLSLFIFSCNNGEIKNDFNFNAIALKQTKWTGTFEEFYLTSSGEPVYTNANAGIFFDSEKKGRYSLKWDTMTQVTESTFEYHINDKILIIENGGTLKGHWLLIYSDKNKMVLEKGTGGDGAYKGIMTLKINIDF